MTLQARNLAESNRIAAKAGRGEIRSLTGIRGVAASWVVILHMSIFTPFVGFSLPKEGGNAIKLGYLAVDLFFVLSGFVLAMTSMARVASLPSKEIGPFFISRICRIYPLHLCVMLGFLTYALVTRQYGVWPYGQADLLATVLLVQSGRPLPLIGWNPPAWSIAAEMLAYVAFPLLAIFAAKVSRAVTALALTLIASGGLAVVMILLGSHSLDHIHRLGPVRCLFEFTAGVLSWRYASLRVKPLVPADVLAGIGLAIFAVVLAVPEWQLVTPLACCALVVACYTPGRVTQAVLGNRLVYFLGTISFSIYLNHFLVLVSFDKIAHAIGVENYSFAARVTWCVAQLVVIIVSSVLTWRYIEHPSQILGRKLRRWSEARWRGQGRKEAPVLQPSRDEAALRR